MRASHIALAIVVIASLSIAGPVAAEIGAEESVGTDGPTDADYVRTGVTTEEDETVTYVAACAAGYIEYPQPCPFPPYEETPTSVTVELWTETNGCEGLQTTDDECGSADTKKTGGTFSIQGV